MNMLPFCSSSKNSRSLSIRWSMILRGKLAHSWQRLPEVLDTSYQPSTTCCLSTSSAGTTLPQYAVYPSWLDVFIKILKYITGIWKCSLHLFWDYPCGCHHCPCKHDICIWVTSGAFWTGRMRVLLHILFCLNYKAELINDKEKHGSTTLRRSPYWASSWPHIARAQVFHVIGELASHHPLLFCHDCKSVRFASSSRGCDCSIHNHIRCFHNTFSALQYSLGKKFSCKICFEVLHFKNANRWMHFQGKLVEIPDEILQVSEERQTKIFSNFITSSCKFQISSSHHVLCWGSTCPLSVHTVTSSWRSRVKTLITLRIQNHSNCWSTMFPCICQMLAERTIFSAIFLAVFSW